jgi:hypothetical protein
LFHGPLTYASTPFEVVDLSLFAGRLVRTRLKPGR